MIVTQKHLWLSGIGITLKFKSMTTLLNTVQLGFLRNFHVLDEPIEVEVRQAVLGGRKRLMFDWTRA